MNIAMISGHYPPEPCGVGDYTAKLCDALRDQGLAVTHLHNKLRSPADVRRLYGRLREQPCDLVHLQYPSGYGRSLLPHLLSLRHGWLVTLHEMSEAHRLRRLAALLFAARARHLVFTTELERELACRRFPSLAGRSSAIPIASNIPAPTSPKQDELVHFGLIRPKKGIEEFLAFVRAAQKDAAFGRYRFRIVGGVRDNQRPYLDTLQRAAAGLPITWSLNLTEREVAEVLSRARLGYLPFPDGLSERRGSALALMANRVGIISTRGPQTPAFMDEMIAFADSPRDALEAARQLTQDAGLLADVTGRAERYVAERSWPSIAQRHVELYRRLLEPHARRTPSRA